jgi:hypothetical protein
MGKCLRRDSVLRFSILTRPFLIGHCQNAQGELKEKSKKCGFHWVKLPNCDIDKDNVCTLVWNGADHVEI